MIAFFRRENEGWGNTSEFVIKPFLPSNSILENTSGKQLHHL